MNPSRRRSGESSRARSGGTIRTWLHRQEKFASPWVAAERGYVDAVIEPAQTRRRLIGCLRLLENKRDQNPPRKHGNIPL